MKEPYSKIVTTEQASKHLKEQKNLVFTIITCPRKDIISHMRYCFKNEEELEALTVASSFVLVSISLFRKVSVFTSTIKLSVEAMQWDRVNTGSLNMFPFWLSNASHNDNRDE